MIKLHLQLFGGRGANRELSDANMEKRMEAEFNKINTAIEAFMNDSKRSVLEFSDEVDPDIKHSLEKYTLKYAKRYFLDKYNDNLKDYGDGFEGEWDEDDSVSILYKDGTTRNLLAGASDGTKKVKTTGIDSIIINGSWGDAYAGKNVTFYNMREVTPNGKYGYKNTKDRYNDFNDIRLEFKKGK